MKTKANVISVEVTPAHFDAAVKKMNTRTAEVQKHCLIVQAVKVAFPKQPLYVTHDDCEIGRGGRYKIYKLSANARRLIPRFDTIYNDPESRRFAMLRSSLPVTITLTEVAPESE